MVGKKNCWEFMDCGREQGGSKTAKLGICPAANLNKFSGTNKGSAGGRICWSVAGTLCNGEAQGSFAQKFLDCLNCSFYKSVEEAEGRYFILRQKE